MRIVFVIYSLGGGGAERVTAILAQHWARAGHAVKVMTFADEMANFYKLGPDVEYESMQYGRIETTLWKVIKLNLFRIFILRRRLKTFRPDVVIGMTSTTATVVALTCIGLPCVTIGAERVHPSVDPLSPFRHFIRRVSYRFHHAVVTQTAETAHWIKAHTSAKAIHVIPNPLIWPLEATEPLLSPAVVCPPDRSIVLAVGRLAPQKGFASLLEAFARICAIYPSWDLVILGTGPERAFLERRRDELGLGERVFFPGRVGNVGDWYERASLFVMTSLYEGFPNALLEAMAYGLPVISTDCDTGPRDLIDHNVNGLLVPPGDQDSLVVALQHLIGSKDTRSSFSERARAVRQLYEVERISQQWHAIFNKTNPSGHSGAER